MNPVATAISRQIRKRNPDAPEAPYVPGFTPLQLPGAGISVGGSQQMPEAMGSNPGFDPNAMTPLAQRRRTSIPGLGYIR